MKAEDLPDGEVPLTKDFDPDKPLGVAKNFKLEDGKVTCDLVISEDADLGLDGDIDALSIATAAVKSTAETLVGHGYVKVEKDEGE